MSMHQEERNLQDAQKNDNYSSRGIGDNSELGKIWKKVMVLYLGARQKENKVTRGKGESVQRVAMEKTYKWQQRISEIVAQK